MKKFLTTLLLLVATIAIAVCFAACNKGEDANDPERMAEVAGTYYCSYTTMVLGDEVLYEETLAEDDGYGTITLNNDGTFKMTNLLDSPSGGSSIGYSGTWSVSGNTIKLAYQGATNSVKVDGNKLIMETTMNEGETKMTYIQHYTKKAAE